MHYGQNFFALPGTNTLVAVGANVFPPFVPGMPTAQDVQRICKIYKQWCPRAQACAAIGCPVTCTDPPCCRQNPRCRDALIGKEPLCCDCSKDCQIGRAECTR